jgi:hypothetical protein
MKVGALMMVGISALLAASCAAQANACGESFCIEGLSLSELQKVSSGEDFNLYDFKVNGIAYRLYEGNQPKLERRHLERLDQSGYIAHGRTTAALVIRTGRKVWPVYLVVTGDCFAKRTCDLGQFRGRIHLLPESG